MSSDSPLVSDQERNAPTRQQLDELLEVLAALNEQGSLLSLTFMIKDPIGRTAVDYRGTPEFTELATRTVRERIAELVQPNRPDIATAIRLDLAGRAKH
jgi:hypothetical protein